MSSGCLKRSGSASVNDTTEHLGGLTITSSTPVGCGGNDTGGTSLVTEAPRLGYHHH